MDRSAREIAAEAVPVEQAPQGARRRPTHRDMPDRRGGDFLDRLDHAPGGSLGATEEGRPVRQDRPHLPHTARNRLKRLQASPPEGRGLPASPIPPIPQETGCRTLAARGRCMEISHARRHRASSSRHDRTLPRLPHRTRNLMSPAERKPRAGAAQVSNWRCVPRLPFLLWPLGRDPAGSRYWPLGDRGGEYSDRGAAVILESGARQHGRSNNAASTLRDRLAPTAISAKGLPSSSDARSGSSECRPPPPGMGWPRVRARG